MPGFQVRLALKAYVAVHVLVLPFVLLRHWWRGRHEPLYRFDPEARFGRLRDVPPPGGVWVHAVSVGETVAAVPLLRALAGLMPPSPLTLTVTTAAARERAEQLLGDGIHLTWMPWDLPWSVRAFLRRTQPRLLVLIETELWPVLLDECARAGVRVVVVNARLSERSASRYRRIASLMGPLLRQIEQVACLDEASATRFRSLGLAAEQVTCPGNIKFDAAVPADLSPRMDRVRDHLGTDDGPLLVAGSTHDDEERQLLEACRPLLMRHPDWRLVLVPRQPQRFTAVWTLLEGCGLPVARYGAGPVPPGTRIILVDVIGELMAFYGLADAAFVGGSLVARGGHNPIEPAWHGVPMFMGPSVFNFADVVERFRAGGALALVPDAAAFAVALERLLDDDAEWQSRSDAARSVVEANRGALGAVLASLHPV